jgi:hypothetical protein
VQSTEPRHRDDWAASTGLQCLPAGGRLFAETEVRRVLMEVTDVLAHKAPQVAHIHHDLMVDQVAAAASDGLFCNSNLPGASNRGEF